MAVRATADRRFKRAQVGPARPRRSPGRRRWRALLGLALVAGGAYAGYRAVQLSLKAPVFRISRINVLGNERLATGEVLSLLKGLRGENILVADLDTWRRRLTTSPWVADVAFRRLLPATVEVLIAERRPVGIGRIGDELFLVDDRGTIIDDYGPNYADLSLPIVDGLVSGAPTKAGLAIDEQRAGLAARMIEELRPRKDLLGQVSQIDVSDVRDAVVILEGDTVLLHVGEGRFAERLQSYIELAPELKRRVPTIDYVDLRFDERLYVRPVAGGPKATATSPGQN